MKRALVVSGLPASGKTVLGKQLADAFGFTFLDKDDFLERLFEREGVGDLAWRQKLSRQSDQDFEAAARQQESVVLVSHWRAPSAEGTSGTPTAWLNDAFDQVIEVFCACPPQEAVRRFIARTRHEGHGDSLQDTDGIDARMARWANGLPLDLGPLVHVDTTSPVSVADVVRELQALLEQRAP